MPSRSVSTVQCKHLMLHTFEEEGHQTDTSQSKDPTLKACVHVKDELVRVVQTEIQEHKAQLDAAFM